VSLEAAFDQVLAAAQANAGWAFARLYESLAPAVAGYLRAQGAREPEDLTSEVFLAVFGRLGSFVGGESQFRSFVFTIAHHRLIDERRALARRPPPQALGARGLDDFDHTQSAAAEDVALRDMATERVRAALAQLAPDQRDVLTLRVIADLSVEQVAHALGKRPGAVKALQRRALERLRRDFSKEGVPL